MIIKRVRYKHRTDGASTERLLVEGWWLLGIVLLYQRETITASNR